MALGLDQARVLDNFDIDRAGSITKRKGISYSGTVTSGMGVDYHTRTSPSGYGQVTGQAGCRNIMRYYRYNTTGTPWAQVSGCTILWALWGSFPAMWKFTNTPAGTNNLYVQITYPGGVISMATAANIDYCTYRNYLFFVDGHNHLLMYTSGTSWRRTSGPIGNPTGSYICVADDRLWIARTNTLWFTNIGGFVTSPLTSMDWSFDGIITNSIGVPDRGSGDLCTGIVSFYDDVYFFRQNDVWVVAGSDYYSFELRRVVDKIGAIRKLGICVTENSIIFCHRSGVYEMFPGGQLQYISEKIADLFEDNPDAFNQCVMLYNKKRRQIWLWYDARNLGYNNAKLVFHMETGSWSRHTHDTAGCAVNFDGECDDNEVYQGHSQSDGLIRGDIGYTVLGSSVPAIYESGDLYLDRPEQRKMVRHVFVQFQTLTTAAVSCHVYVNRGVEQYRTSKIVQPAGDPWGPGAGFWGDDYETGFVWGGTVKQDIIFPMEDFLTGEYLRFRLFVSSDDECTVNSIMPRVKGRTIRLYTPNG